MLSKLLVGTAMIASLVALSACEDRDTTISQNGSDRVAIEPAQTVLMLHRDHAMNGSLADLKAFAADIVPKVEMHIQMANDLENKMRTRLSNR